MPKPSFTLSPKEQRAASSFARKHGRRTCGASGRITYVFSELVDDAQDLGLYDE